MISPLLNTVYIICSSYAVKFWFVFQLVDHDPLAGHDSLVGQDPMVGRGAPSAAL